MRKLLEITTGRHPFQVLVAAACPVAALGVLATRSMPPSLEHALPGPLAEVWLMLVATGGIITNLGAYWTGDLDTGLLTEGAGISLVASMLTIYVTALFLVSGMDAAAAGGFLAAVAAAGYWRLAQITRDVRKVRRAQREGITAHVRILADPDSPDPMAGPGAQ